MGLRRLKLVPLCLQYLARGYAFAVLGCVLMQLAHERTYAGSINSSLSVLRGFPNDLRPSGEISA